MSDTLTARVTDFIQSDAANEDAFNALALDVFAYQYDKIEVVGRLADLAGKTPANIASWAEIPAIPTPAFKQHELFAGPPGNVTHVFESSGTTGRRLKSQSLFSKRGLKLMETSIVANAERMLFNDGRATRILVLAPPPELVPTMIMAWGMARLIHHFGLEGSRFLIGPNGVDQEALANELETAAAEGIPITLIGASFGFVHLLDGFSEHRIEITSAPGSRTMDAGGFKGRSRELTRAELDSAIATRLGIEAHRNVNLLGMTELASQFYDGVLSQGAAHPRAKVNAPWTRTQVVDPTTLEPCAPGQEGVLWHLDLANVERPSVIRTNDLGVTEPASPNGRGWHILGRAKGAEERGCSLAVAELLT